MTSLSAATCTVLTRFARTRPSDLGLRNLPSFPPSLPPHIHYPNEPLTATALER